MTPAALRLLYDYFFWAFDCLWDTSLPALTGDQFIQPLDYSIGSIRNHLIHLISGTRRWMRRLQESEIPPHLTYDNYPTRAVAHAAWVEFKAEVLAYIASLNQAQLDQEILWELPHRQLQRTHPRWQILLHVANHGTDHRAQILAMLHHHFGAPTFEQDMLLYLADHSTID